MASRFSSNSEASVLKKRISVSCIDENIRELVYMCNNLHILLSVYDRNRSTYKSKQPLFGTILAFKYSKLLSLFITSYDGVLDMFLPLLWDLMVGYDGVLDMFLPLLGDLMVGYNGVLDMFFTIVLAKI